MRMSSRIEPFGEPLTARSIRLTTIPTTTTTTAPMTLCQRKAMLVNEATHATEAMPAISPTNAPVPVAREPRRPG